MAAAEEDVWNDNLDDLVLPGFRFHPTDEELVGFYLKRKIQQKPLSIELIKQLDIYKYDPWDLPNELASAGEKEWYFYCPRDRKYRNSARPNRVTKAGFWKATGTDRPVYSSDGSKCIGLKKSLVFYQGRSAKGMKTDWMMHEFRLPSLSNSTASSRPINKNPSPNDLWVICRIFKKANSPAQRLFSNSWSSPLPTAISHNLPTTCTPEIETSSPEQLVSDQDIYSNFQNSHCLDHPSYKTPTESVSSLLSILNGNLASDLLPTLDTYPDIFGNHQNNLDLSGMQQKWGNGYSVTSPHELLKEHIGSNNLKVSNHMNFLTEVPKCLFDDWQPMFSWGALSYPPAASSDYLDDK